MYGYIPAVGLAIERGFERPDNLFEEPVQLSSAHGTDKAANARFWPWLSGVCPQHILRSSLSSLGIGKLFSLRSELVSCSLFARKWYSEAVMAIERGFERPDYLFEEDCWGLGM